MPPLTPSSQATMSGTSMAAPHVSGAVALFLEGSPTASPGDAAAALARSATPNLVSGAGSAFEISRREAFFCPSFLPSRLPRSFFLSFPFLSFLFSLLSPPALTESFAARSARRTCSSTWIRVPPCGDAFSPPPTQGTPVATPPPPTPSPSPKPALPTPAPGTTVPAPAPAPPTPTPTALPATGSFSCPAAARLAACSTVQGDTRAAASLLPPAFSTHASGESYYSLRVERSGTYTISLCTGTAFDTLLYIFDSCPLAGATATAARLVRFDDNGCPRGAKQSRMSVALAAGATYTLGLLVLSTVVVEGRNRASGPFSLTVVADVQANCPTGVAANEHLALMNLASGDEEVGEKDLSAASASAAGAAPAPAAGRSDSGGAAATWVAAGAGVGGTLFVVGLVAAVVAAAVVARRRRRRRRTRAALLLIGGPPADGIAGGALQLSLAPPSPSQKRCDSPESPRAASSPGSGGEEEGCPGPKRPRTRRGRTPRPGRAVSVAGPGSPTAGAAAVSGRRLFTGLGPQEA
eukprot:tig00020951_g16441.t1